MSHIETMPEPPKRKAPSHGWKPGMSGNPKGRPQRSLMDLKELARVHTKEALQRVIGIMRQRKDDKAALKAIEIIFNRGWGMPSQDVKLNAELTIGIATIVSEARQRAAQIIDASPINPQAIEHRPEIQHQTRYDTIRDDIAKAMQTAEQACTDTENSEGERSHDET